MDSVPCLTMMSRAVVTSAFCKLRVPRPNLLICPIPVRVPALKVIAVVVTLIVPSPPRPTKP